MIGHRIDYINFDSMSDAQKFIVRWADKKFPNRTVRSAISKMVLEEIPEFLTAIKEGASIEELELEWADTMILMLDVAKLLELSPERAIKKKMLKNENREWVDNGDGTFQHVEGT